MTAARRRWQIGAMPGSPLPWTPPVASRLEAGLAAWVDAARWPSGGAIGPLRWAGASTETPGQLAARLAEPSSVALPVRLAGDGAGALAPASAIAIVPWPVAWAIVRAALGPGDELDAPRPPTAVERALVAAAVADVLARAGVAAEVGLGRPRAPELACAVIRVAVERPRDGALAFVVPVAPPPRRRALDELLAARGDRLPPVPARIELARGALPAAAAPRLASLARGDVIVVGPPAAALTLARGRLRVALDLPAGTLTVTRGYLRMDATADALADDLSISLAVVAGEVTLSARALLELAPGAVLPLGRPLAGAVDLWAGGRRVARGELVEVDGALGVRVAELLDDHPRAGAAGAAPPATATR